MSDEQGVLLPPRGGYVPVIVPEGTDPAEYIPADHVGNPIAPNNYCRAWMGHEKARHYCRRGAGHGTDHPGVGRCRGHDGATGTTGLLSRYRYGDLTHKTIRGLYLKYRDDPQPFELFDELAILRATLERDINEQNLDEIRPTIEAIGRLVEKMDKRDHVTEPEFLRLMMMMARVVADYVPDLETRAKIDEGWRSVITRR